MKRTLPTGTVFGALTLLSIALSPLLLSTRVLGSCAFKTRLGIPCPTCFTTRALSAIARGDVALALSIQPLFAGTAFLIITWGIWDFFRWRAGGEAPLAGWVADHRTIVAIFIPCAITANWLYLAFR